MKRRKNGYTLRQYAYAQGTLAPKKTRTKKALALSVGFAPSVADNTKAQIENTEGFSNAMSALASENGNVALKVYHELKHRDLSKVDFDKLLNAITTLASAWSVYAPKQDKGDSTNKLRDIILQRVENQTVNVKAEPPKV